MNTWIINDNKFSADNIAWYGNKFLIGNGYIGIRGTMEEYGIDELPSINLAGVYDQVGDKWRESVNAPYALYTYIEVDGKEYRLPQVEPCSHLQELDFKNAIHTRITSWKTDKGTVTVTSERYASMANCHVTQIRCHTVFPPQKAPHPSAGSSAGKCWGLLHWCGRYHTMRQMRHEECP